MIQLRKDYQVPFVDDIKKALKVSKKICAVAPTRSGKTHIFSHISQKMEAVGNSVLLLAHKKPIYAQIIKKLSEFGISAGQIKSGKERTENLIQVGMVQTVANIIKKQKRIQEKFPNAKLINDFDLIIPDEFHHFVSPQFKTVIDHFEKSYIIGFTATPERSDGVGLIEIADTLVLGKSTKWMIDNYWLAKPIHLFPPSPLNKSKIKKEYGDYSKKTQTEIMSSIVVCGNVVEHYRKFFNGAPIIVFCCTIKHCELMETAYKADGWNPVIISYETSDKKREEINEGIQSGKYNQLISCDVVSEGYDVPAVAGVQLLRKTSSLSLYLQMGARGLTPIFAEGYDLENREERKKALMQGKPESIILDHAGNKWLHGAIEIERDWDIDHKKRRDKKPDEIRNKECPNCKFTWEIFIDVCPNCGYDFQKNSKEQKEASMIELQKDLVSVADVSEEQSQNLSLVIDRIKDYKNKRAAMYAILHQSIEKNEKDIYKKIAALCHGLGYKDAFRHRVWQHLRDKYGPKLDELG